jgi:hypothetical protein
LYRGETVAAPIIADWTLCDRSPTYDRGLHAMFLGSQVRRPTACPDLAPSAGPLRCGDTSEVVGQADMPRTLLNPTRMTPIPRWRRHEYGAAFRWQFHAMILERYVMDW